MLVVGTAGVGTPAVIEAFIAGCLEAGLLEAAAQAADDAGFGSLADALRIGGSIKDVGSVFGLLS